MHRLLCILVVVVFFSLVGVLFYPRRGQKRWLVLQETWLAGAVTTKRDETTVCVVDQSNACVRMECTCICMSVYTHTYVCIYAQSSALVKRLAGLFRGKTHANINSTHFPSQMHFSLRDLSCFSWLHWVPLFFKGYFRLLAGSGDFKYIYFIR
jgi:hypothetical protein